LQDTSHGRTKQMNGTNCQSWNKNQNPKRLRTWKFHKKMIPAFSTYLEGDL
jgi:hypothetical protein